MAKNTMELFEDEAPEVAAAFNNLIMAVVKRQALDAKTKQTDLHRDESGDGG